MRTPTPDEVAIAIVTAARLLGSDPIAVASGHNDPPGDGRKSAVHTYPIARARTYAAFGLAEVFPDLNEGRIARWCGAAKFGAASFFGNKRGAKWFDKSRVAAVAAAVRASSAPSLSQDGEKGVPLESAETQDAERGDPVDVAQGTPGGKPVPTLRPAVSSMERKFSTAAPPPVLNGSKRQSAEAMLRQAVENTRQKE